MTITVDRVGTCSNTATVVVEGYSPANGIAHGSLDVTVKACEGCHQTRRTQLISCGMTPYSLQLSSDTWECGDRSTFSDNKYTTVYS